jgi:hypothetical protein
VTIPLPLIVAIEGFSLDHTPPAVALESVIMAPAQTVVDPVITATVGREFTVTVTVVVLEQEPAVAIMVNVVV